MLNFGGFSFEVMIWEERLRYRKTVKKTSAQLQAVKIPRLFLLEFEPKFFLQKIERQKVKWLKENGKTF